LWQAIRGPDHPNFQLASNRQLWRLNTLGRLALVADAEPISSREASALIAAAVKRLDHRESPESTTSASPAGG
jgi:hypothetical protein